MSYVLVGLLFLLIAGALVAFLMRTGAKRSDASGDHDPTAGSSGDTGAPGIGTDSSPFGDTSEHAGHSNSDGETVSGQDAEQSGGTGRPVLSGDRANPAGGAAAPSPERRFQRDPGGGEAEAKPFTDS